MTHQFHMPGPACPVVALITDRTEFHGHPAHLVLDGYVRAVRDAAAAFPIEIAPPGRRSFFTSWQLASQGIAGFTAGVIGLTLAMILTPAQLTDWDWRVPFLICLLLMPIAFYRRREMPESKSR